MVICDLHLLHYNNSINCLLFFYNFYCTFTKSSALSIFMPLILEIQFINGALFLKTNFFSPNALLFPVLVAVASTAVLLGASKPSAVYVILVTVIVPFTTIYASLKSHKSYLSIGVLLLISLLTL